MIVDVDLSALGDDELGVLALTIDRGLTERSPRTGAALVAALTAERRLRGQPGVGGHVDSVALRFDEDSIYGSNSERESVKSWLRAGYTTAEKAGQRARADFFWTILAAMADDAELIAGARRVWDSIEDPEAGALVEAGDLRRPDTPAEGRRSLVRPGRERVVHSLQLAGTMSLTECRGTPNLRHGGAALDGWQPFEVAP